MKTNFQKVVEFNETFGGGKDVCQQFFLVMEEGGELYDLYIDGDFLTDDTKKAQFIKEAVDLLYVTYGLLYSLGIDADKVFNEVHKSNMSKVDDNGKPIIDKKTGKILKGPNYKPVDLKKLLTATI